MHVRHRFLPRVLCALAVLATLSCDREEPTIAVRLPETLAALSNEDAAALVATFEIAGLLAPSPLTISRDVTEASGTFSITATEAATLPFVIKLSWQPDPSTTVLLGRLDGEIAIVPYRENVLEPTTAFVTCGASAEGAACQPIFDLNRNGNSNLDDLGNDPRIDPRAPAPFIDVAPSDLAFASGILLGTFSRQVIVVENTSVDRVRATVSLIDAPGATLSLFETEPQTDTGAQRTLDLGELEPFEEVLVAISFAPVNRFLTVGDIFVEAVDVRTNVNQATRVRLLANVDGELQPPPPAFTIADVGAGARGGYDGPVETFSTAALFNGLPVQGIASDEGYVAGLPYTGGTLTAAFADGTATVPADHAFILDVPAGSKLAVSLTGLESDVDLSVFELGDGDAITDDGARNHRVQKLGKSAEATELLNDGDGTKRVLVVVGRVEIGPPPAITGAVTLNDAAPLQLSAHVTSAPEFTAPAAPAGGPLEGGTRVTLRGRRFHSRATVTFADARALDCTFRDEDPETVLECTAPPGSMVIGRNPAAIVVANPTPDDGGDGQAATLPEGYAYEPPAPRLDLVVPAVSTTAGGDIVALHGAFFSQRHGAPKVFFDTVEATGTELVDSTRLNVAAPSHGAGLVVVTVQNVLDPASGDGAAVRLSLPSNARNFTYVVPSAPAPTLTSIAPATGSVDGGDIVTVTGSFQQGALVLFDGELANAIELVSQTTVTCRTPARATAGAAVVEVINPDGQRASLEGAFDYFVPSPQINSFFPETATTTGGTFIVLDGSGFRSGVRVEFIGDVGVVQSPNVNRVSAATLLAVTPPVTNGGEFSVRVTNVDGQSDERGGFNMLEPDGPAPRIDSMMPNAGDQDTPVPATLIGTDFRSPSVLVGSAQAEVVSFTDTDAVDSIRIVVPVATSTGPVVVRVTNDDGQSSTALYTYFDDGGAPPAIDVVSPGTAQRGNTIVVRGRAFSVVSDGLGGTVLAPGARLLVGGQLVTPLSATATQLTLRVPDLDSLLGATGTVAIELANSDGRSTSATFTYLGSGGVVNPQITSVSPGTASVGDVVTLGGTNFNLATLQVGNVVLAAGNPAFSYVSASQIVFTVPDPGLPLPVFLALELTNVDGRSTSGNLAIDDGSPVGGLRIDAINPSDGPTSGGFAVTLFGASFHPAGTLRVAGAVVAPSSRSPTVVTFTAPAAAGPGPVTISYTNPDAQVAQISFSYFVAACDGNGLCDPGLGESPTNCAGDCSTCDFNALCEPYENVASCSDCVTPCNANGTCEVGAGETPMLCAADCTCGDTFCQLPEDNLSCAADCGGLPCNNNSMCELGLGENPLGCTNDCFCGDTFCQFPENDTSCATDCGTLPCNSNSICEAGLGEGPLGCATDCYCGDTACQFPEDSGTCPSDCSVPTCNNNGTCQPGSGEDPATCAADCFCGDSFCQTPETSATCASDCGGPPPCNNNSTCDVGQGETPDSCAADCYCGDTFCQLPETSATCASDCGPPPCNANAICEPGSGENPAVCPSDCVCGDSFCQTPETSATCASDCGPPPCNANAICEPGSGENPAVCPSDCICGDSFCQAPEDNPTCPADCP